MTVGHIYGIRDPEGREIYVGSTTKTETMRWGQWKAQPTVRTGTRMAVAEDDVALLPVDPALEHKFTRAYENPRFVPGKGQAAVPAQVAPEKGAHGRGHPRVQRQAQIYCTATPTQPAGCCPPGAGLPLPEGQLGAPSAKQSPTQRRGPPSQGAHGSHPPGHCIL